MVGIAQLALVVGLLASACNNGVGKEEATDQQDIMQQQAKADSVRKAFEADYNPVMKDLAGIRDSINGMLATVNANLAKMGPDAKERVQHEALKAELLSEQTVVNDAIAKIDDATEMTWGDYRAGSHAAAEQAKNWWAGLQDGKAIVGKVNGGQ